MVRLVRLLCPDRHCVVALVYESADGARNHAMLGQIAARFAGLVGAGAIEPKCGSCGSRVLFAEDTESAFASLDEGIETLKAEARGRAQTRYVQSLRN